MELISIEYFKEKKRFDLEIGHQHEKHGLITVRAHLHLKRKKRGLHSLGATLGTLIPKEEHMELMKEIRENEAFEVFAWEQANRYFSEHESDNIQALTVDSVFVLSTKTNYIREVFRSGRDLTKIEEKPYEEHWLYLAVKFKGLENEVYIDIVYNPSFYKYAPSGYRINIPEKQRDILCPYLTFDWDNYLLDQLLPVVKERVNFLLP